MPNFPDRSSLRIDPLTIRRGRMVNSATKIERVVHFGNADPDSAELHVEVAFADLGRRRRGLPSLAEELPDFPGVRGNVIPRGEFGSFRDVVKGLYDVGIIDMDLGQEYLVGPAVDSYAALGVGDRDTDKIGTSLRHIQLLPDKVGLWLPVTNENFPNSVLYDRRGTRIAPPESRN